MSGALKTIGTIAGIAATAVGLAVGGAPAAILGGIAMAASVGAGLTQRKPPVLGSANDIRIGASNPMPYAMGRTYVGGTMVHDVGYGPTVKDVPNPYRSMVFVGSGGGPIEQFESFQADYATIAFSGNNAAGYYKDYLYLSTQLGLTPQPAALAGPFGAIAGWGGAYKLSGHAAWLVTLRDNREGKIWSAGIPRFGAVIKGVRVYDQRQDSTYPGGSGACRALQEATYVGGAAAQNPACHAVTYALGRFQNGKKVAGIAMGPDAIDWPAWTDFANTCDANGWKVGGKIEEPGSRWDNLKRICEAGGARPGWVGGKLSVLFPRPRVAIDTITKGDLAGDCSVQGMRSWRGRPNILVPKVRLETHKWEHVQIDEVRGDTYVGEDGEEKREELHLELVQDKDQGAELAAYALTNGRELGPIVLPCKLRLIEYKPGDALAVNIPEEGLANLLCVVVGRRIMPGGRGEPPIVELTLESETSAKHDFALGRTGTAPPTPSLTAGEAMDNATAISVEQIPELGDLATLDRVQFGGGGQVRTESGAAVVDASVLNANLSIGSDGVFSGGGGGQVTLPGIGFSGDTDAQRNARITIDAFGDVYGIGTGAGTRIQNTRIGIVGGAISGIGLGDGTPVGNSLISVGSDGTLAGGGGGQVTIGGLGYSGDLDATHGAAWGTTLSGRPVNLAALAGSESVNNAAVSIGSNGALAGGGGGQVTVVGLEGASGEAIRNGSIQVDAAGDIYGIGIGAGSRIKNTAITISGNSLNGIGTGSGTAVANAGISLGADGVLAGGGGGQVTPSGLTYSSGSTLQAKEPLEAAADVTSYIDTKPVVVVPADHTGALQGSSPYSVDILRLVRNGVTIATGITWSYRVQTGVHNGQTFSTGVVPVGYTGIVPSETQSMGTDEATIEWKAVYAGTTRTVLVTYRKQKAPQPTTAGTGGGMGGTSYTDYTFAQFGSTSPVPISDQMAVTISSAGQARVTASLSIDTNAGAGIYYAHVKVQIWNGSAWVDETSEVTATIVREDSGFGIATTQEGTIAIDHTKAGLTGGSTQTFRLVARSAQGVTLTPTGQAGAQG